MSLLLMCLYSGVSELLLAVLERTNTNCLLLTCYLSFYEGGGGSPPHMIL